MAEAWMNPNDPGHPYPLQTFRHRYVSPFGGFSTDLYPGEIGVRCDALQANTDLDPDRDHILVTSELDGRRFPLFTRETFRIVPLDDERPDALFQSPRGEVVFSCFEDPTRARPSVKERLRAGIPVFLNAAAARMFGGQDDLLQSLIDRVHHRDRGA